jgi:ribosomal protein S18 acetylase RimI-like enzyme
LRLTRDWRQVIALIEVAFGEALDADAQRALHSMRPPPGLATVIGFFDSLALPGEGMMPGFVWLEGGKVVGTASVRRVRPNNHGWLVSNVAVHPDWQGRGIGRALLETALDFSQDHGGSWVVLQVRDDNAVARKLYESLGFRSIGDVVRLRRAEVGATANSPPVEWLRPARWYDGGALGNMARTLTPHDMLWADVLNRDLYRTGRLNYWVSQMKGSYRRWWVQVKPRTFQSVASAAEPRPNAAVGVEVDPRKPWHRLRLLISSKDQDEPLASDLTAFGLGQLTNAASLPVEIEHPASDGATQSALADAGFERIYALTHMRLDFKESFQMADVTTTSKEQG